MKYEFIRNHAEEFDLNDMCEALVIHRSGYLSLEGWKRLRTQARG